MSYPLINGAAINDDEDSGATRSLRPVFFGVPSLLMSLPAQSLQPVWFGPGKIQLGEDV